MARRAAILCVLGALGALIALTPSVASAGTGAGDPTPSSTEVSPADVQGFTGTLIDSGEPVADVTIVVETLDGDEVGRAESGQGGAWTVPVPEPGRYRVTLVERTLPADSDLRDPDRNPLEVDVFPDRPSVVLFALGEFEGVAKPNFFERLAQNTVNGLKFGLIVAITSIGLSLIFGTTGLINFAHGEIVTLGAVIAWFLNARGPDLPLVYAGIIAVALTGLFGGALDFGVWRPLRARQVGLFQLFVITIGLSFMIRHVILIWFGGRRRTYTEFTIQEQWDIGPISITPRDLIVMVASAAVLVGVATMLQRTRIGKAMRAVSDNVELSEASGIDVQRVILVVWVMSAALAAIGGVFLGTLESVSWEMGTRLLLLMFAAVILGGLGTAYGAMVGGLAVGLVTEVSTIWVSPALKYVFALGALVLALMLRPQGILGRAERVG